MTTEKKLELFVETPLGVEPFYVPIEFSINAIKSEACQTVFGKGNYDMQEYSLIHKQKDGFDVTLHKSNGKSYINNQLSKNSQILFSIRHVKANTNSSHKRQRSSEDLPVPKKSKPEKNEQQSITVNNNDKANVNLQISKSKKVVNYFNAWNNKETGNDNKKSNHNSVVTKKKMIKQFLNENSTQIEMKLLQASAGGCKPNKLELIKIIKLFQTIVGAVYLIDSEIIQSEWSDVEIYVQELQEAFLNESDIKETVAAYVATSNQSTADMKKTVEKIVKRHCLAEKSIYAVKQLQIDGLTYINSLGNLTSGVGTLEYADVINICYIHCGVTAYSHVAPYLSKLLENSTKVSSPLSIYTLLSTDENERFKKWHIILSKNIESFKGSAFKLNDKLKIIAGGISHSLTNVAKFEGSINCEQTEGC